MQPSQPSEPVEEITLRIGNLELQITARVVDSAGASTTSLSGFEIVRGTVQGASNRPGGPIPDLVDCPLISQNLESSLLSSSTPEQLGKFTLPWLEPLVSKLNQVDCEYSNRARIVRAYRAGVAAHRRLLGYVSAHHCSPSISLPSTYFVILRSVPHREGC